MNENICFSSHRFGNNLDSLGVDDSSDFPGHSRGACATILELSDIRTVLCSISTLRLLSDLHHTTRLFLAVLQTSLDRHPRAGMLCARQSKFRCGLTPGHCFCHVSSQPASFSETTSTVLVKTSRTVYVPDIDCSLSILILISLFHLSLDLPIAFESFSCQLPQIF